MRGWSASNQISSLTANLHSNLKWKDRITTRRRAPSFPLWAARLQSQAHQGSKFKVEISRFRVRGSRFKVQCSRFRVQGSGFKVQGSRFKVQGSRFRVQGCTRRLPGAPAASHRATRFSCAECQTLDCAAFRGDVCGAEQGR